MNQHKIKTAISIIKDVIAYRFGEKLIGMRNKDDASIDLRPIFALVEFTDQEREELMRQLQRLEGASGSDKETQS